MLSLFSLHIGAHVHTCTHTHHSYTHMHTYMYTHALSHRKTYMHTHMHAHTSIHTHTHIHIPETFPKWLSFLSSPPGKDRKLQVPDGMYLLRCFFIEVVFAISLRDKTHRRQ